MRRVLTSLALALTSIVWTAPATAAGAERLAGASSPYLRQHADNPIDWYPWGEAAFARARAENKPIFLSIGYSTCYWCHVMAREVFSDAETAALLNAQFIAVLVDSEERPDLDRIYMPVRLLTGGETGWPLSVFLTPDLKPFLAAGYIPNLKFREILTAIGQGWAGEEARYREHAAQVLRLLAREHSLIAGAAGAGLPARALVDRAVELFRQDYDPENGGFEVAPKFPRPAVLELLLARGARGDAAADEALAMARGTLDGLAAGAIHDQLGGGFHRYTEDRRWRVPHFEKMLYDNAMLLHAYAHAHVLTGETRYRQVALEIADYALRELAGADGLFRAAQDSESGGVEGGYYTWRPDELAALLGPAELAVVQTVFGLDETPAFDGAQALRLAGEAVDPIAEARLASARGKLIQARRARPAPFRDDKAIAGWNGLMIEALAYAGRVLGRERELQAAARAARAALARLVDREGRLFRVAPGAGAGVPAQLDDYAGLVLGLSELYRATGNALWRGDAARLAEGMRAGFADGEGGAFFDVASGGEALVLRPRNTSDGAVPAGNSLATRALDGLAALGLEHFDGPARRAFAAFGPTLEARPDSLPYMLWALENRYRRLDEGESERLGQSAGVVRLAAEVVETDAGASLQARLEIDPGWHVNADPPSFDYLIATTLAAARRGVDLPAPSRPPARTLETPLGPFAVYEDAATFGLPLPAVDDAPLTLTLRTQACNDKGVCLLPSTLEVKVVR